jgi:hypothetical protein
VGRQAIEKAEGVALQAEAEACAAELKGRAAQARAGSKTKAAMWIAKNKEAGLFLRWLLSSEIG